MEIQEPEMIIGHCAKLGSIGEGDLNSIIVPRGTGASVCRVP